VPTKQAVDTNVSGRRRNRSWPEAVKREIVAASLAPGASVSLVARQYDVNTNQVFRWRQLYRTDGSVPGDEGGLAVVPVTVRSGARIVETGLAGGASPIEIVLIGGYRVRVDAQVDAAVLHRVLDALERR
jgi:transposase